VFTSILKGNIFGGCDQILNRLREAEILLGQGEAVAMVSKKIGVATTPITAGAKSMVA